jgi:enamine deaminase RidA (YjgF/YER057c/UK114 family)
LNIYVVDMAHLPILREIRDGYVNAQRPPASTAVQVSRLAREEFLLEIEVVAAARM